MSAHNLDPRTFHALERIFGERIFQRGLRLAEEGAVLRCERATDGFIEGDVQGSRSYPYTVFVQPLDNGGLRTACTCPYASSCKHAAALAIEWFGDRHGHGAESGASTTEERVAEDWVRHFAALSMSGASHRAEADSGTSGQGLWIYDFFVADELFEHATSRTLVARSVLFGLRAARRCKAGHPTRGKRFHPGHDDPGRAATTHEDEELHTLTLSLSHVQYGWIGPRNDDLYELEGATGAVIVALALKSGRAFLGDERRQALAVGETRTARFEWQAHGERHQLVLAEDFDSHWVLIPTEPPYYLDVEHHCVGELKTSLSIEQLVHALEAPPLTPTAAQALASLLAEDAIDLELDEALLPLPDVALPQHIDVPLQPVLVIRSANGDEHVSNWVATPVARYADHDIGLNVRSQDAVLQVEAAGGEQIVLHRDLSAERIALIEFHGFCPGFLRDPDAFEALVADYMPTTDDPALRFGRFKALVDARAELEALGWQVRVLAPVHTRTTRTRDFSAHIEADDDAIGWFELGLTLTHRKQQYDLLPLVVAWLEGGAREEPVYTEAHDGTWLEVPASALAPVGETLRELGDTSRANAPIRLSRARALSLETLSRELEDKDISVRWTGEKSLLKLGERLRSLAAAGEPGRVRTPRGIKATMRPYQLAGLGWLNLLAEHGLNGILADDMGLGKTLQTIAHIVSQRNQGTLDAPTLVVAPTSLLGNWARELARFAPRLGARVWHGPERHDDPLDDDENDVIITSYTLALRDHDALAEHGFGFLVLDESQAIKNPATKIARAVNALPIDRRLCITGTPLENHLGELWSQFDCLMPGLLGDRTRFTRHFRTPIERHGNTERQERLAAAIRPFILRRRKQDVAAELPPKTEIVREVRMDAAQARLYESIRIAMEARVRKLLRQKGMAKSHIEMLDALLKLRQTCCHPDLVKLDSARKVRASAKTDMLMDMIDEMVAEGRKILVFSQFTEMLGLLERELATRDHRWVKLTGQTRKRDTAIDAFQNGDVPVFLISLKAGGTGLNLTAADTVIHYDPWWNPAVERQASDRAHRIGQTRPVFVYKLVTEGTVEERIVSMQASKQALADATIEHADGDTLSRMSADDVLSLFAPSDAPETA